ncbi:Hypothetical protein R9X50_00011300 [Acrodontium crateriforme]|uniref:Endoplasmic reticulum lectin n=1 Tax=Acrodontium crateriforme TaxID=150365 RepID=A0AAQ3LWW0_9PEZI|nr:Hypothetical protein R9X50_00011300 [Acrodontium crateriforme]
MKHFFALPALLRPALLLASASQHSFSVNDDLLAYPQYEVHFPPKDYILDSEAAKRMKRDHFRDTNVPTSSDSEPSQQVGHYKPTTSPHDEQDGDTGSDADRHKVEYEYMVLEQQRYLCAIPQIEKPIMSRHEAPPNATLAKVEEQKELARATYHGWELMEEMSGECVYFFGGWWSYRFCYGQGVKQFHQMPRARGTPAYPPLEDPSIPGFELGLYKGQKSEDAVVDDEEAKTTETGVDVGTGTTKTSVGSGELVQRGDSRYLVQRLDGGTTCDLTGKPRKIEVQFHCNPQMIGERITMIKEIATCAYQMVIQTSRLCKDVAFQPPQKDIPNIVSCSRVLSQDEIAAYEDDLAVFELEERKAEEAAQAFETTKNTLAEELAINPEEFDTWLTPESVLIGDIKVGGHALVPEGHTIEKSTIVGGGKHKYLETVASSKGDRISEAKVKKLGLHSKDQIDKLCEAMQKQAGGKPWRLDLYETPRGKEFRGIFGDDIEDEETKGAKRTESDEKSGEAKAIEQGEKPSLKKGEKPSTKKSDKVTGKMSETKGTKKSGGKQITKQRTEESDQGSEEEYFKHEEL